MDSCKSLANVKNVLLVLSGKGGVGKSSVTAQLALCLAERGLKIGVLDIDLTGPSIPLLLGLLEAKVQQGVNGWIPCSTKNGVVMSLGFLLDGKDDAVIWRGPKKNSMITQFIDHVVWGDLDYLIIDTPPGTSDEHITIMEKLRTFPRKSAVLVTTPQAVSLGDVRREINFCEKATLRITGIIENMSGFICPYCEECNDVFSSGGGEEMAESLGLPFLGRIPLDPTLTTLIEESDFAETFMNSQIYGQFQTISGLISGEKVL